MAVATLLPVMGGLKADEEKVSIFIHRVATLLPVMGGLKGSGGAIASKI
ncbi:hypothetical protein [Nostoc sp. PCC 7120 = FACHB-418]